MGRRKVVFKLGNGVWVHFRKERFPQRRKSKLDDREDGPFQILEKINDNAYKVDLLGHYNVSATFNVSDLFLFDIGDGDSRMNPFQEGKDDVNWTKFYAFEDHSASRAPRGRGRGRSRARSSLSSVIDPSPCSTFPYTDAFPTFINPFIENWKNVIGDGNCEVRRRMVYELKHTMNMYISLFGSGKRVYELIRRTQWQNGPAHLDHWLETIDSLYVIANAFNLCVILIARLGSITVLPLYSYSNRPRGTFVIGLMTEQ
ncbi:hypothetical protein M9H77_18473 [Catharanthus roseus]|uniref:Uncharacterized protein n=1 Tax=Catharanthus roseus TaxID=4058 RepID=A0ACC0B7K3_CATRO|nr:hypothetical protein M9H77_18473 [Catharanthus roseus]